MKSRDTRPMPAGFNDVRRWSALNIVFMGTPDFAAGILKAILDNGYTVTGVVTQPDRPKGRKKELCPCPVKELAVSRGLRVFQPRRVRNEEAVAEIADMKPDLIVVAAFGQILPKELLELPPLGCVNVHASLLPAYRGAAPIQQAIIDGCEKTGVTIMQMDVGLDTGDIISVRECPISPEETGGSLFDKLAVIGAELLVDTLPDIESGKAVRVPQPEENVSYVKMFKKEDGRIDWTESAETICRKVRGFDPWPSAFTTLDGKNFRIFKAHVVSPDAKGEPGAVHSGEGGRMLIQTGSGYVCPDEVQIEGKKRMKTSDFLRGYVIKNSFLK